ncbi:hypothetical protein [Altericroceibacterium xinjiangense]|uniref:hypothetical protein n=1 Tax=Altericroceibacterium xinjiangense TaxID=762261 RepID=UPI000F7F8B0C|nr:hypothetical protein [Altericroceibacterium xinjiangense]
MARVSNGAGIGIVRQRPWKSALLGFAISLAPVIAIFLWLYMSAEIVAAQVAPQDAGFQRAIIDGVQQRAGETALLLAVSLGIHWVLAGFLGKNPVHNFSSANVLLTLAFATFLVVAANDLYGWIDTYCDQLPFPHTGFQITRISECPSSGMFFSGLLTVSLALLLLSLIVRVVASLTGRRTVD